MKPTNKLLLRWNQRQMLLEDKKRHERMAKDPLGFRDDLPAQHKSIRAIDKMLAEQGPEPLTGAEKDLLSKRSNELAEEIRGFMVPREEMRRSPTQQTNAVYQHLRREGNPENKKKILEWKNIRVQLEPDSDDPNQANADFHLRPERGIVHKSMMVDAMGPRGHLAMSSQAKDNWPLGEATADTALAGAQRVQMEKKQAARDRMAKARDAQKVKRDTARTATAAHVEVAV